MTKKPPISVVMPLYNASRYLKESINSILDQTFDRFEFIIVNDGSTDDSKEIVKSYNDSRITFIEQKNQGVAAALNNGIINTKSNIICRMDADDISYPRRIELQYQYLLSHPSCVAVGANADIIDQNGNYIYTTNIPLISEELKKRLHYKSPFIHPTVTFRKEYFLKAGMYPNIRIAQDLFLFKKMAPFGEFGNIKMPLIKYRLSPSASTRRNKKTIKALQDAINYYHVTGKLEDYHIKRIKSCYSSLSKNEKYYQYHLLLAKKYLWNNYKPHLSRKNLFTALTYKSFSIEPYLMYIFSFLPTSIINKIYKGLK